MSQANTSVVLIGECMIELQRRDGVIHQGFAGDVLNTATYLARLTQGQSVDVEFATGLGDDSFSEQMMRSWADNGVAGNLVKCFDGRLPGIYFIETDDLGERKFYYWRNDSAAKRFFDQPEYYKAIEECESLSMVYLSGISLAILPEAGRGNLFNLLNRLKERGVTLVFDNNYRPILWDSVEQTLAVYDEILALADIALLTWDDEKALRGFLQPEQVLEYCEQFNISELVVKCGPAPCLLRTQGTTLSISATPVSKVIDTTAAGDSFSAGYLAARIRGIVPERAVLWGHKLASTVIQYRGAIIPKEAMPKLQSD